MNFEITKAREQHKFYAIPVRDAPDEPPLTPEEIVSRRRSIRMVTDSLIHTAFLNGDVVQLVQSLVETMTCLGGTCAQLGIEPQISDFLLAAKDLTEDARALLDKAIVVKEYDQVRIGVAMLQCVVAGVCAICGLPYRDAMELAHRKYVNAEQPTPEDFRALLIEHGFTQLEQEAQNDD